jgi:lipopolysaccharide/colanic/teichoic acid biosynthesis glycosyltransferase
MAGNCRNTGCRPAGTDGTGRAPEPPVGRSSANPERRRRQTAVVLLLGSGGERVAADLEAAGWRVARRPWREAEEHAGVLPAETAVVALVEPGLSRGQIMSWVAAAGARGMETLAPAEALPVLKRAGAPLVRRGEAAFYRFAPPPSGEERPGARLAARLTAALFLPPTLLLLGLLALLIRLTDGPPVLFVQQREGGCGGVFRIFKLRTMRAPPPSSAVRPADAPGNDGHGARGGTARRRNGEARITPLGAWLRRHCLDELPQIFNLLRGDILLIGPRPLPLDEARGAMAGDVSWQAIRARVRSGLTGLYQVTPRRRELDFDDMCVLDAWYVHNRNRRLDLRILLRTLPAALLGRGESRRGKAPAPTPEH